MAPPETHAVPTSPSKSRPFIWKGSKIHVHPGRPFSYCHLSCLDLKTEGLTGHLGTFCWRLATLGCSPYILHSHWRGNATTTSYKPKQIVFSRMFHHYYLLPTWYADPGYLVRHHQTPIDRQWFINTSKRAKHPSSPSVTDTTRGRWNNTTLSHDTFTLYMNRQSASGGCPRNGKWEKNLARSGDGLGRFSLDEDIRQRVLPFVCLLSVYHRIFHSHFYHPLLSS